MNQFFHETPQKSGGKASRKREEKYERKGEGNATLERGIKTEKTEKR